MAHAHGRRCPNRFPLLVVVAVGWVIGVLLMIRHDYIRSEHLQADYWLNPTESRMNETERGALLAEIDRLKRLLARSSAPRLKSTPTPPSFNAVPAEMMQGAEALAPLVSLGHQVTRRRLNVQLQELFYALERSNTSESLEKQRLLNHTLSALATVHQLHTFSSAWHKRELIRLSAHIQGALRRLQHPPDCATARILVCDVIHQCGLGCRLHRLLYCLRVAVASNRTTVLLNDGRHWGFFTRFSGWSDTFLPITNCTYANANIDPTVNATQWMDVDQRDERVVFLPEVAWLTRELLPFIEKNSDIPVIPEEMYPSVPQQLLDETLLHTNSPHVFFNAQFLWHVMRESDGFGALVNGRIAHVDFSAGPIVGLQIRRTDKLIFEGAFHAVSEYMHWADTWFRLEGVRLQKKLKRRVFVASDDPNAVTEIRRLYPNYEVLDAGSAQLAGDIQARFTSDDALVSVMADMRALSRCNYLVCTMSSRVCRVAYELMQAERPHERSSEYFHSLDDAYYCYNQGEEYMVAVEAHSPVSAAPTEMELRVGDVIRLRSWRWTGVLWPLGNVTRPWMGTNLRTGTEALFPRHKVDYRWRTIDLPLFAQ